MKYIALSSLFILGLLGLSYVQIGASLTEKNDFIQQKETKVLVTTDYGNIILKLYNETPKHRDNFIKLANEKFYDGLLFHRVMENFMIQGGDPDSKWAEPGDILGNGGPGYTVPSEFHPNLFHKRGALAAARTNNPEKASSGSQFYIVQGRKFSDLELGGMEARMGITYPEAHKKVYQSIGGYPSLDQNYTVFGEVLEGMDVVERIATLEKDRSNRPNKDVAMTVKILD
ncbi:MAG: peptidylprolyl isomerase [Bacteroidia bacterium]|nr:peptidylprolyl isomerase [Bacteroidia bacterium]